MRYVDDNTKSLEASHYAGALVVAAILALFAIRYIMEP